MQQWLSYQEQLHPKAIELGLSRVRQVAGQLGLMATPPCTITVGGTNGKGSTATLLALIYRETGLRVGSYTSPHLYRYNERIALDAQPVSDAELCQAFAAVERARGDVPLTYFEFGTLAALWLFRQAKVDVQVLEVGLGGRLDAVNVLDADAAIVTQIGLDHQDWLGDSRDAIGREKAGIYRSGQVSVLADPQPPAGLIAAAAACGAQLLRRDQGDYRYQQQGQRWHWQGAGCTWADLPLPALEGAHQLDNAAAALMVVSALRQRLPVSQGAINRALGQLQVPGRLEQRGRFLLDVAHNAEAAEALAAAIQARAVRPVLWIAGVLADKPIEAIARALAPVVEQAITCTLDGPRGVGAEALAQRLHSCGLHARAGGDAAHCLHLALQQAAPDQTILICGSFYTVAALAPLLPHD